MRRWNGIRSIALALTFAALATTPAVIADPTDVSRDGGAFQVRYTANFNLDDLTVRSGPLGDVLSLPEGYWLGTPGEPRLPTRTLRIALPAGMRAVGARLLSSVSLELDGAYDVAPAQPPLRMGDRAADYPPVPPDPAVYGQSDPYPAELVRLVHQSDLAGQPIAHVELRPVQYVPSTGRLILHTSLSLVIEGVDGYVCGDYLPQAARGVAVERFRQRVAAGVVNPSQVELAPSTAPLNRGVGAGDYEYVVITHNTFADAFAPLVAWKTRKGVPATVVTTDWIFNQGGYSGSDPEMIRAFVIDAYNQWGTTYFLIGGDTNVVTVDIWTSPDLGSHGSDDIPNDTYYADFDDDWQAEVHVGRCAARDFNELNTFINKVLTYETNPPLTDYAKTAFFTGFDLNQLGSGEGEGMKADMRDLYLPADWTYRYEYDSEPGEHYGDVIAFLNQGSNLVNHSDHSSTYVMGVGSTNHGDHLDNADMNTLTNGNRQSILYTLGCWAGDYNANTCIGEAFVQNPIGGGVAFVGNSRYGWYVPYDTDGASARFDRYFFRSLFDQNHWRLGECFTDHKNDAVETNNYMRYIFKELTLLGDPELPIWTENPSQLDVTYPAIVPMDDGAEITVTVEAGPSPVGNATVCLWKEDEGLYVVEQTDAAGVVTFNLPLVSMGELLVTASKRNCVPHLGAITVEEGGPASVVVTTAGAGSVMLDPAAGPYDPGTVVELQAQAEAGWAFDHWEGAVESVENPVTLLAYGEKSVTAVFEPDCNGNAVPDHRDFGLGLATDCNYNRVPDECELGAAGGLAATYFDTDAFDGLARGRVDATVDFDWGEQGPWYGFGSDTFTVRWTGYVATPSVAGVYTFYTRTDDGVRLWVDGELVVEHWADQAAAEHSGTIELAADELYPIKLEYYENTGAAVAALRWEPPGMAKEIIPAASLVPALDCDANGYLDVCDVDGNPYHADSEALSPLGGVTHTYTLIAPPDAMSDVTFSFLANGDLSSVTAEYVDVYINGAEVGRLYAMLGVADCVDDQADSLVLSATEFNMLKGGGNAAIELVPSFSVNDTMCGDPATTYIRVQVDYTRQPTGFDCNENGVPDACDIAAGSSSDGDGDGVPDECQAPADCAGDANCDGAVNWRDIDYFVAAQNDAESAWAALFAPDPPSCPFSNNDANGDGGVNWRDIDSFVALQNTTCP